MKTSIALALLLLGGAAQAQVQLFSTVLSPEVNGATGSGSVDLSYDPGARTLSIDATWEGLSGGTTIAHIHGPTAVPGAGTFNVAVTPGTLPGLPTGVTAGSYSTTLDLSASGTYTGGFLTLGGGTTEGAEALLIDSFYAGTAYFNLHSSTFGSGEIRGFIAAVPEPGTYALMALGLAAVAGVARRRQA